MNINSNARKKIRKLWDADPQFNRKKAAEDLKVNIRTVHKWISVFKNEGGSTPQTKPVTKIKPDGNLNHFRANFDDSVVIPGLIEDGIEKYLVSNGEPAYMTDRKFREACGISITKWRRYADDFKYLQVSKNQEIYWGHPDIIDEMRKAVNR